MKSLYVFIFFIICGCASKNEYTITEQNGSINQIIRVIKQSIGEPRKISENSRVYFSDYFTENQETLDKNARPKVRFYAVISILGDRRPYDIETKVVKEILKKNLYQEIQVDQKFSKSLKEDIKFKLHKSLEKENILDDFRVF